MAEVTRLHLCQVLTRSDRKPPAAYAELVKLPRVSKVTLKSLTDQEIAELICSEHKVRHVPEAIASAVLSRTKGNPFYAVVLVESLVEAGACHVADGVMSADEAKLSAVASVGDRLERVLISKVDRTGSTLTLCHS